MEPSDNNFHIFGAKKVEMPDPQMAEFKKRFDALDKEEEYLKYHGTDAERVLFTAKKQAFLDELNPPEGKKEVDSEHPDESNLPLAA